MISWKIHAPHLYVPSKAFITSSKLLPPCLLRIDRTMVEAGRRQQEPRVSSRSGSRYIVLQDIVRALPQALVLLATAVLRMPILL